METGIETTESDGPASIGRFRACISAVALAVLFFGGCASGGRGPMAADLDRLEEMMTGSFASTEQAVADPSGFKDVRLHVAPIWEDRRDGRWLYVEQAMAASVDKPYRQRVYRLGEGVTKGTLESDVFELPGDPLAFAGAWADDPAMSRFAKLNPRELQPRRGCTIVLRPVADGTFSGATLGTGCESSTRGATYATSEVTISEEGTTIWDRGYNEQGKQVWGTTKGPYRFDRVSE